MNHHHQLHHIVHHQHHSHNNPHPPTPNMTQNSNNNNSNNNININHNSHTHFATPHPTYGPSPIASPSIHHPLHPHLAPNIQQPLYPPHLQAGSLQNVPNSTSYTHPNPLAQFPSQFSDFRVAPYHQTNRPLIVSTPTNYTSHPYSQISSVPTSGPIYRHIQTSQQVYSSQETLSNLPHVSAPRIGVTSVSAPKPQMWRETREPSSLGILFQAQASTHLLPNTSEIPASINIPKNPIASGFRIPILPWLSVPSQPFPHRKVRAGITSARGNHTSTSQPPRNDQNPQNATNLVHRQNSSDWTPNHAGDSDNFKKEHAPVKLSVTNESPASLTAAIDNVRASKIPVVPFIPVVPKISDRLNSLIAIPTCPPRQGESQSSNSPTSPSSESNIKSPPSRSPSHELSNNNPPPPKSWADLVRAKSLDPTHTIRKPESTISSATPKIVTESRSRGLSDVLGFFTLPKDGERHQDWGIPFLQPRGLVNTGNMCFMNSILQALLFCGPFFLFLNTIGREVIHNFNSQTPLLDSMIVFMREFRKLKLTAAGILDKSEMEKSLAGDPFVPEYVYEAIRSSSRFSSMRRGHQQDAEEFLNIFLDVLHEECVSAEKLSLPGGPHGDGRVPESTRSNSAATETDSTDDQSEWLEVGHKQRVAITRHTGHLSGVSPITLIFSGQMRNELRVSGQRSSVMREPYQSLQLDIQNHDVHSVVDAIRLISVPEQLQGGDFKSPRGTSVSATKQAFIDCLPPVLILHLKRFQYDNTGGTQKIWKNIDYPLDLNIPSEALSAVCRNGPNKPHYKLKSVVYHHGKSAANGHYTVDVRRQDGWIRLDDTLVRRVSERDTFAITQSTRADMRRGDGYDGGGWKEVSFTSKASNRTHNSIYAEAKDDKVAYILFYELR